MNRAKAFLERFRAAEDNDAPLAVLVEDSDGWAAAMADSRADLSELFGEALGRGHGALVTLHADCFATAACDQDGTIVVADPGFDRWFGSFDPFDAIVRGLAGGGPRVSMLADDRDGRPVALAAGTMAVARRWPLSDAVRTSLEAGKGLYAIAAFRAGDHSWDHAARAYGLTAAEAGLVASLARLGDLQRAAVERGIAYETARKFVASALQKTGAKRQTELVRLVLMTTAGDIPDSHNLADVIADLFSLSERQAMLAVLVAQGMTRERAAEVAGLTVHRAKADLKVVFQACGVENAVDLARLVSEVGALKGLASACEVLVTAPGRDGEPLRLVPRRWAEGRIAVSDHGPQAAKPVLVMHSTVTGRHHPASFIAKLQRAGYRPITMDRPGFGLTDWVDGDPVKTAIHDLRDVMAALDLQPMPVIARCTLASVIACEAGREGLLTGGILVWPDAPLPQNAPERRRMSDRAAQLFARYPDLARPFVQMLCRRTSNAMMERLWRKAAEGLPGDTALLDDPAELEDLLRGSRQALQGMHGFMAEALALTNGPLLEPLAEGSGWTAFFGSGYESYDVADGVSFWGGVLPGGTIRVIDNGVHFLHATHTDVVVEALERAEDKMAGQAEALTA